MFYRLSPARLRKKVCAMLASRYLVDRVTAGNQQEENIMDRSEQLQMFRTVLEIANLKPSAVTLPEDHQVIIGSMRFHYLDWGGGGPPLLFLHGGGLNAHTWDAVCVMLRDFFRCVALDQRGHGDSE